MSELREQYERETGRQAKLPIDNDDFAYLKWLERRLAEYEGKCTCDPGHICDGNRGHSAQGCQHKCPVHGRTVT